MLMPKSAINDVVIIGSGNVATSLVYSLLQNRKNIIQIYSRNKNNAEHLAGIADCSYTVNLKELNTDADLYIIAIQDDAIESVISQLLLKNGILVHTAGSVEMNILKSASNNYGVLYPLQTLNKNKIIDFYNKVPLCVEANTEETRKLLYELSLLLSKKVIDIDSEQRKIVHLAAVFANNFTNYMHISASRILKQANISTEILKPLIIETSDVNNETEIYKKLTGPAIRKDIKTIEKQIEILKDFPDLKNVYEIITENMLKYGIL